MTSHPTRSTGTYMITEPYDGSHVRILVCARTPEAAELKWEAVSRRRTSAGYTFFEPIRRVIGKRADVENMLDRQVAALPGWDDAELT